MSDLVATVPDLPALLAELVRQVPAGRVTTHGQLAEALGSRMAARWIGSWTLHHEHGADCPCHRVIRAGGDVGLYQVGSPADKARRLAEEGVRVEQGRVDWKAHGFQAFTCDRPLERLRRVQEELVARVQLASWPELPELVGGVDVSYPRPDEGVAAYALVDVRNRELVWSTTVRRRITFPYISSYLAFRELPILLDLLATVREAKRLSPVLLVDGNGILHQRHAGIATHLGVLNSWPTVGVTKKLLVGQVDLSGMAAGESRAVMHQGRMIGRALRATARSRRPIFLSPGHQTDIAFAETLVRAVLAGHRLPEPLYWADRLSRAAGPSS